MTKEQCDECGGNITPCGESNFYLSIKIHADTRTGLPREGGP